MIKCGKCKRKVATTYIAYPIAITCEKGYNVEAITDAACPECRKKFYSIPDGEFIEHLLTVFPWHPLDWEEFTKRFKIEFKMQDYIKAIKEMIDGAGTT